MVTCTKCIETKNAERIKVSAFLYSFLNLNAVMRQTNDNKLGLTLHADG